jgi:CrcB protein
MREYIVAFVCVGIGGALGAAARYSLSLLAQRLALTFPFGTVASNLAGCFLIGVLAQVGAGGGLSPSARLLLATGFCGGFTTLSSFVYEAAGLVGTGAYWAAGVYVVATLGGACLAFLAGLLFIHMLTTL